MRNILEYPVTYQEKVELLEDLINTIAVVDGEHLIGDMRPSILMEILDDVKKVHNDNKLLDNTK